ncbi:MAG: hypothetical protein Q7J42_09495 [Sulfuritalea sp.]|nr:hypothetical protein [Sulfuritalea sp.]
MNTYTSPHVLGLDKPRSALRPATLARTPAPGMAHAGLMERLAAWAERQPAHHRLGSWERLR